MKRDFLGDASGFQPVLLGCLGEFVGKADKDLTCSSLTNQFQCLVTDGIVHEFLGFLHTKRDIHATVTIGLYVLPCQLLDVALSQTSQTSKEESGFQDGILAWGVRQPDKFILGQMLFFRRDGVNALQEPVLIIY